MNTRHVLIALALATMLLFAGCAEDGQVSADNTPTATENGYEERPELGGENQQVYEDKSPTTVVRYEGSRVKTIYWADKTVCTVWESAQEGGVSCLPFDETQVDNRYPNPLNNTSTTTATPTATATNATTG